MGYLLSARNDRAPARCEEQSEAADTLTNRASDGEHRPRLVVDDWRCDGS
jgi:hypothetical protein